MFGLSELAVILIVIVAILAVKKLPELTRSAGKAARILKSEKRALKEEGRADTAASGEAQAGRHVVVGKIVERNDPPARS
ncbi:twin-arginine translocase TatA/TatE family subunit [Streptomyces sp. NPDC087850]